MCTATSTVSIACQEDSIAVVPRTMYDDDSQFTCIVEEFTHTAFKIDGLVRVIIFSVAAHANDLHISYFFRFSDPSDANAFSSHVLKTARQHEAGLSRPNYEPEVLPQLVQGDEGLGWSVMDLSGTHPIGGEIYKRTMTYFQNIHPTAMPCTKVYRAHVIPTKLEI